MILDADQIALDTIDHIDVCIVGAGAAGISLALALEGSGLKIVLLESGTWDADPETQNLYAGDVADPALHPPPDKYRLRQFGGSSVLWGGRCMPLDPIDFEARPWIAAEGWPIRYEDLEPYYPPANRLCEAGAFAYRADLAFPEGMKPLLPGFHSSDFADDRLERFSRPTNFARIYGQRLTDSADIHVVMHANVVDLTRGQGGAAIESVSVATLKGRRFTLAAKHVVLATGGLEVPRLLLASGIGNEHDQVGRHYMCHIAGTIGDIEIRLPPGAVWHGYQRDAEGVYCRRRFALTEAAQRRLEIGNFVARLHHPDVPDASHRTGALSALFLAQFLIGFEYRSRMMAGHRQTLGLWLRHIRNVVLDPVGTAGFFLHLLRDRKLAERKFPSVVVRPRSNRYSLDFHAEQQPNPQSRVTLSDQRDELGMKRIKVDWRYTPLDIETVREAVKILASDIEASGCGKIHYDPARIEEAATRYGAYGGHHIGTARMSADPRQGVVDADCRVHGMSNLYVAGAAVFPTSSQANPTLSAVALALRLADHLKTEVTR